MKKPLLITLPKRIFDIFGSLFGLLILSPLLLLVIFLIWKSDKHSPFYIATRVGKNEKVFKMIKLRSMIIDAEATGVDSTGNNDSRITPIGQFIRKYKLDEITQLVNVFIGQMSLVGPRPNVKRETDLYTDLEKNLLTVKPGITDFASIVFSDEGSILANAKNPDIAYNQLIRPGKSRLALFYVKNMNFHLDFKIVILTLLSQLNRKSALEKIARVIEQKGGSEELIKLCLRQDALVPSPPPGSMNIVTTRDLGQ